MGSSTINIQINCKQIVLFLFLDESVHGKTISVFWEMKESV